MQAIELERQRQEQQRALLDAATGAPVLVRMTASGAPVLTPSQPTTDAVPPLGSLPGLPSETAVPKYPQDERAAFLASSGSDPSHDRLVAVRQNDPSPYELHAGSVIPATLLTGINADLPGTIVGQVREDVYDSVTGTTLLIPRGTKLVGTYDSRVIQGQSRVLVTWTR
ncbi:MAG: TrbI/VirB10 family protein, partial [Gemmataceae bacterium]